MKVKAVRRVVMGLAVVVAGMALTACGPDTGAATGNGPQSSSDSVSRPAAPAAGDAATPEQRDPAAPDRIAEGAESAERERAEREAGGSESAERERAGREVGGSESAERERAEREAEGSESSERERVAAQTR
ncbi:hypothetical protein [Streptomyces cadmiisoli]|uniref:hypothetical protein n=1 Tax=Streptomyces cadmiisoli TaxID=2184053 RepID=UPI0036544AA1